jgi:hypothetical protein
MKRILLICFIGMSFTYANAHSGERTTHRVVIPTVKLVITTVINRCAHSFFYLKDCALKL